MALADASASRPRTKSSVVVRSSVSLVVFSTRAPSRRVRTSSTSSSRRSTSDLHCCSWLSAIVTAAILHLSSGCPSRVGDFRPGRCSGGRSTRPPEHKKPKLRVYFGNTLSIFLINSAGFLPRPLSCGLRRLQPRLQNFAEAVGDRTERAVGDVRVSLRRARLSVAQQLSHHVERRAARDQVTGIRVPQVVDPDGRLPPLQHS